MGRDSRRPKEGKEVVGVTKKWWQDLPKEYWYRMGDIGMQIAFEPFRHLIEEEVGQTVKIINGHRPLYIGLQSPYVENFDEEACHLDLVAAKLLPNLNYFIHAIAEVKSTVSSKKTEFNLNGMAPRYVGLAMRKKVPVYLYVVRFPEPLSADIVTEEGAFRAYMEYRDLATVQGFTSEEYYIDGAKIGIRK